MIFGDRGGEARVPLPIVPDGFGLETYLPPRPLKRRFLSRFHTVETIVASTIISLILIVKSIFVVVTFMRPR
jgi:hypothetical protein